jgi:hypothetical protein
MLCKYLYAKWFELQGLNENKQKNKKTGAFAMCIHTANMPNGLCYVYTHGKEPTWRPPVHPGIATG